MAVVAGARAETKDPRQQLNRLFNMTISDQEVGDWLITADFFGNESAVPRQPDDPAIRGRIIREAVWRLIEAHDRDFLARPARTTCTNEKCAECAKPAQWHVLALLYSWERGCGFGKLATIDDLCALSADAATEYATSQRQQSSARRRPPADRRLNDPVLRQGRGKSWYTQAKRQALDGLYAHLTDYDDPVALQVLRVRTAPQPAPTSPWDTTLPAMIPNMILGMLTVAPPQSDAPERTTEPATDMGAWPSAPGFEQSTDDLSPPLPRETTAPRVGEATATLPATPRFPWLAIHWKRWLSVFAALALLLACLINPGSPPSTSTLTWHAAGLSGWLVARQSTSREPRILAVINLRTGAWRALWPPQSVISGQADTGSSQSAPGAAALTSPTFTVVGHRFAYIARDGNQVAAIYEATLALGRDGWPEIAGTGPRLVRECKCSALTWTPSGQWLIYNSPSGLMATSADGASAISITHNALDAGPACSPDGRYLAYQQQLGGIVALPTHDCLPDAQATQRMRYLNGYSTAWAPSWSPDSQTLSFVSNVAGKSAVYVIPVINLSDHPRLLIRDTAQKLSGPGCGNPVWSQRIGYPLIQIAPALVFGCDQPTPDDHHGALGASSALGWPRWSASLSEGTINWDSLCWIPENL